MKQMSVSAVFDRKKMLKVKGTGKVELQIRLSRNCRKYITLCEMSALEWKKFEKSEELAFELKTREDGKFKNIMCSQSSSKKKEGN